MSYPHPSYNGFIFKRKGYPQNLEPSLGVLYPHTRYNKIQFYKYLTRGLRYLKHESGEWHITWEWSNH